MIIDSFLLSLIVFCSVLAGGTIVEVMYAYQKNRDKKPFKDRR